MVSSSMDWLSLTIRCKARPPKTYPTSGPRCPEQATGIHSAPSVLLACSGLSSARVPSFIHSFMGVCLTDLAIANQKVSFNCIKDCCTITGSITEISEQRVMVHPIYLRSQNSELGVTSHSSWPCSICKSEKQVRCLYIYITAYYICITTFVQVDIPEFLMA